jgi:hypothetical protein
MLLECPKCHITIETQEIGSYTIEHDGHVGSQRFTLLKCPNCLDPLLAEERLEYDYGIIGWGIPQRIYPSDEFHINPIIPEHLRKSLKESIQCLRANSYTATVIMCRRTIEGFCKIKGVNGSNLAKSIEKLKGKEIINSQLYEWANELRLIGNEAAHNIETIFSAQDARDSLEFTIAILDFTYSFKEKFENFKHRRNLKKDQKDDCE